VKENNERQGSQDAAGFISETGCRSHPLIGRIYSMLEKLQPQMKAAGYVPDMRSALHTMEKEHK